MLSSLRQACFGLVVVLTAATSTNAYSIAIDFESQADLEDLTTQYSSLGVTFENATVFTAGISLNEFDFPPTSGSNVAFDNGGMMTITFSASVESVGGYFTYAAPLSLVAYDTANAIVASATSAFDSNYVSSGTVGATPSEFLLLFSAFGISRITLAGDPAGGSFTLDDLIFTAMTTTPPPTAVPEPATLFLFGVGLIGLASLRRSRAAR